VFPFVGVDDSLERSKDGRRFNHDDEHKPDRTPRWVSLKHQHEDRQVHREESRECKPKPELSKIILMLSKKEPQQKTSPDGQSNPSFGNFYTRLRKNDNNCRKDQQANDRDSNELGRLQSEDEEPNT